MSERLKIEVLLAAIDKVTGPLKAITKGSSETSAALRAARGELAALRTQSEKIDTFRKVSKDASITGNMLKASQERIRALKEEIAKVPAPTRDMSRALKEAQSEASALKMRHNDLIARQQQLRTSLTGAGIDTHKLVEHSRELTRRQDEAAKAVARHDAALKAQNETLRRMHVAKANYEKSIAFRNKIAGASAGMGIAGAAISAPAGLSLKNFETLEAAETLLRTSMMDASGNIDASFERIKDKAIELGNTLPGATRDFLNAARELKQQGMNSSSVVNGGLTASSYLGVRFGLDQTRTAEFIAKAREAHGLKDNDLPTAADYMHRAREAFGLRHDDIYESMKYAATDLNLKEQVGDMAKMKEYLVLQGIAGQAGLEGSTFGTNFSHMLKQMAAISRDAKSMKGALGDYVFNLLGEKRIKLDFYDKKGNFGGFEKMFVELSKLNGLSPVDQELVLKKLFDTEGSRVAALILKKGLAGYKASMAQMENVASLRSVIEEMQKTLQYQQENFTGNVENLSAMMGAHLKPFANDSLKTLNKLIDWVREFNKEHPGMVGGLVKVGAGLGTLLLVASGVAAAIAALLGPLALAKVTLVTLGITGGAAAAGILAVLKPILLVAGAAYLGWQAGKLLGAGIDALLSKALGYKTTLGGAIYDLVQIVSALPGKFLAAGRQMIDGLIGGIQQRWQALKSAVSGIADSTVGWLRDKLGIRSPSRVFAEIGGFAMAGLEQGLLRGKDGPLAALAKAAKGITAAGAGMLVGGAALAMPPDSVRHIDEVYRPAGLHEVGNVARTITDRYQGIDLPTPPDVIRRIVDDHITNAEADAARRPVIDTRPPLGRRTADASAAAPMIVQITINPTPGMDEAAIGRYVATELQRIDAQRAARHRARLRDMD